MTIKLECLSSFQTPVRFFNAITVFCGGLPTVISVNHALAERESFLDGLFENGFWFEHQAVPLRKPGAPSELPRLLFTICGI